MHSLELRFLQQLMDEQIETQLSIRDRNFAIWDNNLSLDEALRERKIMDIDEEYLIHLDEKITEFADQGFLGYNHPGGLTTFFYGYQATPPSAYSPGCYSRNRR